jgi:cholesterol transport system auxiliary component
MTWGGDCARGRAVRRRKGFAAAILAALSVLPGGCSTPRATFDLSAPDTGFKVRIGRRGQVAVAEPTAIPPTGSDRIVVRTSSDAVAYLSGAQWADQLPVLIQNRLIETFGNAHLLNAVGRPGILADYKLHTDIRRFELDAARRHAVVEISAQLMEKNDRIAAGKIFSASAPAAGDDGASVAAALDSALGDVMRQIVLWTAPQI